jgi:dTDP-4-dehydrorhamnose 3,5-epimerase
MSSKIVITSQFEGSVQQPEKSTPIEGVLINPVAVRVDDRQSLAVYLKSSDESYRGFAQSYISTTMQGVVKAWHYHLKQTDIWYVAAGKIKVGLFDAREDSPTCGIANSVIMGGGNSVTLSIPPGVFHGYVSLSSEAVLINTTDQPYDPTDEYRVAWDDHRFGFSWDVENR